MSEAPRRITQFHLAFPVRESDSLPVRTSTKRNVMADLGSRLRLGIVYDAIEVVWSRALWLGWQLRTDGDTHVLVPPDAELEKQRTIGLFRYTSIATEGTLRIHDLWNRLPEARRTTYHRRIVNTRRSCR